MKKDIQILSPEWTYENKTYLSDTVDSDELMETLDTAFLLPVPFDCEISLTNSTIPASLGLESMMDAFGILDPADADSTDLTGKFLKLQETYYD